MAISTRRTRADSTTVDVLGPAIRAWIFKHLALVGALALASASAHAQSFNIDIDVTSTPGVWTLAPATGFGGAANQTGFWNAVAPSGVGPIALRGLNNALTTVSMSRSGLGGAASGFAFDNTNTSGNYQFLLDDMQSINAGITETITISGLNPGDYEIYTYAIAIDNSTLRTNVSVAGSGEGTIMVGGVTPVNSFAAGVTHSLHRRTISIFGVPGTGSLSITLSGIGIQVGSFNGLQIKEVRRDVTYVRASAPAGGDGGSWATAFSDLAAALVSVAAAPAPDPFGFGVHQVWVATGNYKPTTGTNRNASFVIPDLTSVYGGFAGNETELDARNSSVNQVTLTGSIGAVGVITDNTYHVVRFANGNSQLTGVTISDGYDDDPALAGGAGIHVTGGTPRIYDCRILNNTSIRSGAGVRIEDGSPIIFRCSFINNRSITSTDASGGAIILRNSRTRYALIQECAFLNNFAQSSGGAVWADTGAIDIVNTLVDGNRCGTANGGGLSLSGRATLTNCTIVNNASTTGRVGGVGATFQSELTNCVLWGNTGGDASSSLQVKQLDFVDPDSVNFSIVQGWITTPGNPGGVNVRSINPGFRNALGADGLPGTIDDDLRPAAGSPMIDAGYNGALAVGGSSDLAGQSRIRNDPSTPDTGLGNGAIVDLGCYEYQPPVCRADFNNSGAVSVQDIFDFITAYFMNNPLADVNASGAVTVQDIFDFLGLYFAGC